MLSLLTTKMFTMMSLHVNQLMWLLLRGAPLIRKVMEGVGKFLSCMNVFVNMSIISLVIFPLH